MGYRWKKAAPEDFTSLSQFLHATGRPMLVASNKILIRSIKNFSVIRLLSSCFSFYMLFVRQLHVYDLRNQLLVVLLLSSVKFVELNMARAFFIYKEF